MRNIAKRSVAWLLLAVMVFSCFQSALVSTFASEDTGSTDYIVEAEVTEPSDSVEDSNGGGSNVGSVDSENTDLLDHNHNEPTEPATETTEAVTEPTVDATEPPEEATEPIEEATEPSTEATEPPVEVTEPTEPATEPSEEVSEPEVEPTEPVEEPTEPTVEYSRMEAEVDANINLYDKKPLENEEASEKFVVGGQQIESVFQLDLFDDLATSTLEYMPYVKYNVGVEDTNIYEIRIGVALENLDVYEEIENFYLPVVVNEKVYKAICNDFAVKGFEFVDGIYEFFVEVKLVEGKNAIYCLATDADMYLELIGYNVSAVSEVIVNFDYLDIPEGVEALEKDEEPKVEVVDPVVDTTEPTEPTETPTTLPEGGVADEEVTTPSEPSEEVTEPSEEVTEPTEPEEPEVGYDPSRPIEEGLNELPKDMFIIPPGIMNPSKNSVSTYAADSNGEHNSNIGEGGGTIMPPKINTDPWDSDITWEIFFSTAGITMQVVYFPYGQAYNRYNSYDRLIEVVDRYTYTDENGREMATVYDGRTLTTHTFIGDTATGRVYKLQNINLDTSSDYYKTVELISASTSGTGGVIHPGYHDCVSGPAVVTKNANGTMTYTMPKPNDIELFLKKLIYGSSYGAWDVHDVVKDSNGVEIEDFADIENDVSLYTRMLRYLGCEEEYIQNYQKGYTGELSTVEDADVMIPTIIWSYVVVDCMKSSAGDGFGYAPGSTFETVDYVYVDPYAVPCCDGKAYAVEKNNHGTVNNKTFHGRPNRTLIAQVFTVNDIIYTSFYNNITSPRYGTLTDAATAVKYMDNWWRGIAYNDSETEPKGYDSTTGCRQAYNTYHNQGGNHNGCAWYGYASYACGYLFGNHNIHQHSNQRNYYGRHAYGGGFVNSINAEGVDNTSGQQHYFRGYWTPYGEAYQGDLSVSKSITPSSSATAANLEGWKFNLYRTEEDAKNNENVMQSAYTNNQGVATFIGLKYNKTFYIKEAPASEQDRKNSASGWTLDGTVFSATVPYETSISVGTATNAAAGALSVTKVVSPNNTAANRKDWRFELYTTEAAANAGGTNFVAYAYTDDSGVAKFDSLAAGTYYVREAPASRQDKRGSTSGWTLSTTVLSKSVTVGVVTSMGTITNSQPGSLSVTKTVAPSSLNTSANRQNWRFELYTTQANANAGTNYIAYAYTDANGVATFSNLIHGTTYYVREAPASRQDKKTDLTGWTLSTAVMAKAVVRGTTTSVGTATNTAPGSLSVTKNVATTTQYPASKADWKFELYASLADANAGTNILQSAYTDANGVATFTKLKAGTTYFVREAPVSRQDKKGNLTGWTLSTDVLSKTVVTNTTTSMGTITNGAPAMISVQKAINSTTGTSGKLQSWVFEVSSSSDFSSVITLTTNSGGQANTGWVLTPGTYYVREASMDKQIRTDKANFTLDTTVVTVTVSAGESKTAIQTGNYTSRNTEKGMIRVTKGVVGSSDANARDGWIFYVYSNEACTNRVTTITTMNSGEGISGRLAPGNYWVKEAPIADQTRADKAMWVLDDTVTAVTVTPGGLSDAFSTARATAVNYYGKYISIMKVSDCPNNVASQLADNDMYSLAGAKYNVIVDGDVVETLTTNASGLATSTTMYPVGTKGILVEIEAPKGYILNSTPVEFEIPASEGNYVVTVKDRPTFDPATPTFTKVDPITGNPQGNTTFEGAIFRMDYYDNTSWSGTPTRTWYFKTNANGYFLYSDQYVSTGYTSDALYKGVYGEFNIPIGSIKLTEVVAPAGYSLMPALYAVISQPTNGQDAEFAWTADSQTVVDGQNGNYTGIEPTATDSFGSISIQKLDKDFGATAPTWATFAGCEFVVYNRSANSVKIEGFEEAEPGEICATFTVGDDGKIVTDKIFPIGEYEVFETKGNEFYQCNAEWSQTFEVVAGDNANNDFEIECENTLIPAELTLEKINPEGTHLAGAKFALEWSEDGATWHKVFASDEIVMGGCSSVGLDANGCLTTDDSGIIVFSGLYPAVYYRLTEVEAPNGYQLLKDHAYTGILTAEEGYKVSIRVVNAWVIKPINTGAFDTVWMSVILAICATMSILALAYCNKKERV